MILDLKNIKNILEKSDFKIISISNEILKIEDPNCIIRTFESLINMMWQIVSIITGLLLFGYAISLIRRINVNILKNIQNLVLIFGILTATKPILDYLYGNDLFGLACDTVNINLSDIQEQLNSIEEYENADIYNKKDDLFINNEYYDNNSYSNQFIILGKRKIAYLNNDGTKTIRQYGTVSWRNKNPGNIRYSAFSKKNGAIGEANGFAVFPSEEVGMRAIKKLLLSNSYKNLSIKDGIFRYAPPFENDTKAYYKKIEKLTGIDVNKKINSLSDSELEKVVNAIKIIEGFKIGQEYKG